MTIKNWAFAQLWLRYFDSCRKIDAQVLQVEGQLPTEIVLK